MLSNLRYRLRALFRRNSMEAELDKELRAHVEQQAEKYVQSGMPAEEATRCARLEFGGIEQVKEECRDSWGVRFVGELAQDLSFGLRQLRHNPGFTAVAVLTLALGIGANTAIFSVVNAVLLRPLPYPHSDRLEQVMRHYSIGNTPAVSATKFVFWREHNQVFSSLAAYDLLPGAFNLTAGSGHPEHVSGVRVSGDFFRVLGVNPELGRYFTKAEERPGSPDVVVISHGLWEQRFGGDPSIIGKQISLSGTPYTIVGVMPAGFESNPAAQLWTPLRPVLDPQQRANMYLVLGRLKPGVTLQRARSDMTSVAMQFRHQYPDLMGKTESISVTNYQESLTGNIRPALLVLMGAVALVLLIACANVANLLLARSLGRNREIAIRTAIGAGRARLVRQLLTESVLLALVGSGLGLLFSDLGLRSLVTLIPNSIPQVAFLPGNLQRIAQATLDTRVLIFTILVALLVGIIFGLAPAFQAFGVDINNSLREGGGRTASAAWHGRLRSFLVAGEIGLSLVLLAGAALLIKTLVNLQNVNPGFDPQNVLTMKLSLTNPKYATTAATSQFMRQVLDRVNRMPGIQQAAFISNLPMQIGPDLPFQIAGRKNNSVGDAQYRTITPGYFSTMKTPLLQGRVFTESDNAHSAGVVIINKKLAQDFFPGQNPIGQQMTIGAGMGPQFADEARVIVGVVGNTREQGLNTPPTETMFIPWSQLPNAINSFGNRIMPAGLIARTRVPPMGLSAPIAREVLDADSTQPAFEIEPLDAIVGDSVARQHFNMVLLGIFAALALLLASVGLYGVVSYSAAQRTHEVGIRLALGAQRSDVVKMVVGQGLKLVLVGVTTGIACAFVLTRFLASLLYGVKPTDPLTFIAVSLILIGVALVACYIPARRAAKVDPMVALRYE